MKNILKIAKKYANEIVSLVFDDEKKIPSEMIENNTIPIPNATIQITHPKKKEFDTIYINTIDTTANVGTISVTTILNSDEVIIDGVIHYCPDNDKMIECFPTGIIKLSTGKLLRLTKERRTEIKKMLDWYLKLWFMLQMLMMHKSTKSIMKECFTRRKYPNIKKATTKIYQFDPLEFNKVIPIVANCDDRINDRHKLCWYIKEYYREDENGKHLVKGHFKGPLRHLGTTYCPEE
jgi:hypothetical protein